MPIGIEKILRFCGAFLLFLSGVGGGVFHQRRLCQHTKALEEMLLLLRQLRQETVFRHADLRRRCESRELRVRFPSLFLSERISPPDCFSTEEREAFEEWIKELGHRTAEEEGERLEWYIQRFGAFHAVAAQKQAEGERLNIRLGAGIGAVVALLVL